MITIDHFRKQFEYDYWANGQTHQSIKNVADPPEKVHRVMAHLISAEWAWLNRMGHPSADLRMWPEMTTKQIEESIHQLGKAWQGFLEKRTDADLDTMTNYSNTKGETFENSMRDILTHMLYHSAYHRGQVATLLRDAGHEPAATDYIFAIRDKKF